jgi:hypothetical protein
MGSTPTKAAPIPPARPTPLRCISPPMVINPASATDDMTPATTSDHAAATPATPESISDLMV